MSFFKYWLIVISESKNKGPASLQQVAGKPGGVSASSKYNRGGRGRGRKLNSQKSVPIRLGWG